MFISPLKRYLVSALCLMGMTMSASAASYSHTSTNWPTQMVIAQPKPVTFTLSNNTSLAAIMSVELNGPFTWQRATQNGGTCPATVFTTGYSLNAGASCTVIGALTPQNVGEQTLTSNIWIHEDRALSSNTIFTTQVVSDDAPVQVALQTSSGATVTSISLTQPQTLSYQFKNLGTRPVTLSNFVVSNQLHHVMGNFGACNTTLVAGASCSINFTATQDSYGADNHGFSWQVQQDSQTVTNQMNVSVGGTTVVINQAQDIVVSQLQPGSFTITNTGNFSWQVPVDTVPVTFIQAAPQWVNFSLDPNCQFPIAPGGDCKIKYSVSTLNTNPVQIIAHGANIVDTQQNFVSSVPLAITADLDNQHLMYRAIKITNWASNTRTISVTQNAVPKSLANQVELCTSKGNCVASYTQVKTCADLNTAMTLAAGDYCMIWYHTLPPMPGGVVEYGDTLIVSISATDQTVANTAKFNLNYGVDLYVGGGGDFSIMRWDGINWYTVGGGLNDAVRSMSSDGSDLYIGGDFTNSNTSGAILNYITQWNGTMWKSLQKGLSDTVRTIVSTGDALYLGGDFATTADGLTTLNAIARWENNMWHSLNKGLRFQNDSGMIASVSSLIIDKNTGKLYVGGGFNQTAQSAALSPYVAQWDGQSWSALGTGSSFDVLAFTFYQDKLYASGDFQGSSVAQWDGKSWIPLTSGPDMEKNQAVWALASMNNNLFAGGIFTNGGLNYFSRWDGKSWQTLTTSSQIDFTEILALAQSGSSIYVGGYFSPATGSTVPYNSIARWDGTSWQALGPGLPADISVVYAMQADIPHLNITPEGATYQASISGR